MRIPDKILAPSKKELYVLRFMIVAGLAAMAYLLFNLFTFSIIDNAILYSLLMIALSFTCLKILHEWYHYFYIVVPATPVLAKQYTVDIFTTFCAGEPYEMMIETLTAIQAIKYPHTTYLCDEADDPFLKNLCDKLGIKHITRVNKIDAKAGNINNALQYATGEVCVILDPDHVPLPNFLDPIISHFNDPKVGFVQIVQAYKNFHEGLIAKGAAQQTFQFYGPMMMTMNRYGTVLAIGANCTFRRSALDSIGGHAPGLAEDMHTAMQLHAKGWKSVYVPEVLARGLVPSTLSAYYSQQLKWSRGVFELLVTSYPKLFKQFTWRQKLHYGIIPFYYFSGFIFLINFLIPILSLFFEENPIKMDFYTFALIGFPLIVQIILIRNYVQRWVMEDEERGFHIVGGLLAIGTWWIFITGLIYTLIRRKVPYVPTPKDSNEENNWPLNIPNLIILFLSLSAIGYGLYIDWNPYTLVMAGLAGINCLILIFNIAASRQATFRKFKKRSDFINLSARQAFKARRVFRQMRIKAYAGIRTTAFILTLMTIGTTVYLIQVRSSGLSKTDTPLKKKDIFLSGIFAPKTEDGLSSIDLINSYNVNFDIISLYIPWGNKQNSNLPLGLIDSIYKNGAIPMITWEPWQNLFSSPSDVFKDIKVLKKITNGDYDRYLSAFAQQIRRLDRPVYLRFAHEADNPSYPWSPSGGNSPEDFIKAWRYVHDYFNKEGAYNAIWVWNPWKPEAVKSYFPGEDYVDWIGITNLNYGRSGPDKRWYSMEQLYAPFHKQPLLRSGIPVMLAEMGSLKSEGRQNEWFKDASTAVKLKYPEIKAFVLFNSGLDKNIPVETQTKYLDWRVANPDFIFALNTRKANTKIGHLSDFSGSFKILPEASGKVATTLDPVRGVTYSKGLNWIRNYNTLRNKEIKADFKEIKSLGFNTIKRYGPNVFDDQILELASEHKLKIKYAFYIPDDIDYLNDKKVLQDLDNSIVSTIRKYKNNKTIVGWNLGNTPFQKLGNYYFKPDLLYYRFAYAKWLKKLVNKIKTEDPSRPATVDVELSGLFHQTIDFLEEHVPEIDAFGIVVNDTLFSADALRNISSPYYLSKIKTDAFLSRSIKDKGYFIADWQDQERSDLVTFDGLKDNWGRKKVVFHKMKNHLKNTSDIHELLPRVNILKPAATIYSDRSYTYHALINLNNEWKIAESTNTDLVFNWYLVKTDGYGNGISLKFLNTGPRINVIIPDNHKYYQLYLNASKGRDVTTARSALSIPLSAKAKL